MPNTFFTSRFATRTVAVIASAACVLASSPAYALSLPNVHLDLDAKLPPSILANVHIPSIDLDLPNIDLPKIDLPNLSDKACGHINDALSGVDLSGHADGTIDDLCGGSSSSGGSSSGGSSSGGGGNGGSSSSGNSSSSSSSVNMGNLILNGDFETLGANGDPAGWNRGGFGNNNREFRYPVDGFSGKGAEVFMTQWADGDAKWYFNDVNVTPGVQYSYTNRYKSTVPSFVTVQYTLADGTKSFSDIGNPVASSEWAQFSATITPPANTVSLTVFHLIKSAGSLYIDSFDLHRVDTGSSSSSSSTSSSSTSSSSSSSTSSSSSSSSNASSSNVFDKGYVTLNFDDGWTSHHRNVMPILNNAGIKGTFFVVSDEAQMAEDQDYNQVGHYLTINKLKELQAAGHEVTAHSKTHASLIGLSENQMKAEIGGSRTALLNNGFTPVDTFAYPFGDKNAAVMQVVKDSGFVGARGVNGGYNTKVTNKYDLEVQNVLDATTAAQMKAWIDHAVQTKTWLNIVFHEVDAAANAPGVEDYSTTTGILQDVVNYLKTNNIAVITTHQGMQMMP